MSTVLDIIKQRRSIQSYKDIPISQDQWSIILDAATYAPNSGNIQDWRFIVVNDQSTKDKLADACHGQSWMTTAPLHIVCCSDTGRSKKFYGARGETMYTVQNVAAAIQNMLITATDMGLASSWVGSFEENQVCQILDIPSGIKVHAILTVGYANEVRPTPQRQPLYACTFINSWGNSVSAEESLKKDYNYAKYTQHQAKKSKNFITYLIERFRK